MTATPPAAARRVYDPVVGASEIAEIGLTILFLNYLFARIGLTADVAADSWPWLCLGGLAGLVLPLLYWNGFRVLGLVPVGFSVALLSGLAALLFGPLPLWALVVTVAAYGLVSGSGMRFLCRGFRQTLTRPGTVASVPMMSRVEQWATGVLRVGVIVQLFAMIAILGRAARTPEWWTALCTYVFFAYGLALTAFAWFRLFRPFFELCVEPALWLGYRIRGAGPGLPAVPYHGPLLVVANHACWWDPLFLAKLLPRPVTPMMTARFFDVWFLRPLMVHTFQVIRVPEATVRRDAPEIRQAIAALDAGRCVILFPEGYLRRKEDQPLRRFGRGVWEILRTRPDTPVLACWIEGGWGSWASYFNGKPTRNKKPDFRRPIRVGVSEPVVVKAELLGQHLRTRVALMNLVIAARTHLGLPPLPAVELPQRDEAEELAVDR